MMAFYSGYLIKIKKNSPEIPKIYMNRKQKDCNKNGLN